MQWDRLIKYHPGEGEGDGGGGEPSPADDASASDNGDANVMASVLSGEDIPKKFQGKTVQDVLKSYASAERKITQLSEAKKAESVTPAPIDQSQPEEVQQRDILNRMLPAFDEDGQLSHDAVAELADELQVPSDQIVYLAQLAHTDRSRFIGQAQEQLSQELEQNLDVLGLVNAAKESGLWTADELADFDRFLFVHKSIEPLRIVAKRLTEEGVDISTLQGAAPKKGLKGLNQKALNQLQRGSLAAAGSDEVRGFQSRALYQEALLAAQGDPVKTRQVQERLQKSDIKSWADRTVLL